MQIVCPNCQAEYDLDPPAAPFARDQDLVFRCTACSTAIPLRLNDSGISDDLDEEPDTDVVEAPPRVESFILLRQGGSTYRVENTAQLQRWIAERRIWPDDEVAVDGGDWQRVGDIEAYSVFFKLVEDAERIQGKTSPASTSSDLAPAAAPSPPKKPRLSVSVKAGLFAKPAHLDVASEAASESSAPTPTSSGLDRLPVDTPSTVVPSVAESPAQAEPAADVAVVAYVETDEAPAVTEVEEVPDTPSSVEHAEPADPPEVSERFGEVVPEEEPMALLTPDQPTMDMELEEEDFFSEEHDGSTLTAGVGFDGDDDLLEWGQQRRKNMVMWWLMFFGALGGAAYLALDFLNSRDAQVEAPVVEAPPADDAITEAPAEVAEEADAGTDSGVAEAAPEASEPENEATLADEPSEPSAAPPAPEPDTVEPTPPPPPKKPSASAEVSRGWAQIDRENWSKARTHFETALQLQPANPDARFGMAYVNEQQGRMGEAVSQYCRLSATASGEVKSEAEGRLRALAKDCP